MLPVEVLRSTMRETLLWDTLKRLATAAGFMYCAASTMAPLLEGEIGTPRGMVADLDLCKVLEVYVYMLKRYKPSSIDRIQTDRPKEGLKRCRISSNFIDTPL